VNCHISYEDPSRTFRGCVICGGVTNISRYGGGGSSHNELTWYSVLVHFLVFTSP